LQVQLAPSVGTGKINAGYTFSTSPLQQRQEHVVTLPINGRNGSGIMLMSGCTFLNSIIH